MLGAVNNHPKLGTDLYADVYDKRSTNIAEPLMIEKPLDEKYDVSMLRRGKAD